MAGSYHQLALRAQNRGDYPEAERRYQRYFPDSENLRGGWLVASDPFPD